MSRPGLAMSNRQLGLAGHYDSVHACVSSGLVPPPAPDSDGTGNTFGFPFGESCNWYAVCQDGFCEVFLFFQSVSCKLSHKFL